MEPGGIVAILILAGVVVILLAKLTGIVIQSELDHRKKMEDHRKFMERREREQRQREREQRDCEEYEIDQLPAYTISETTREKR